MASSGPSPESSYECCVCDHQIPTHTPGLQPASIDDSAVCPQCQREHIRPMFEAAYEDESKYPVTWGSKHISPTAFPGLMPSAFLLDWSVKTRESE
ncbi:hypothetical protein LTR53_000768 [Teratosphaeriaceae sp. CCFEE 6253]|nr:hypothetical protein LTR53_000768 [Teratosphaeriaceae sp. CCFEE 6253]